MNAKKYERPYFLPPVMTYDWVKKTEIEKAPVWCSVDLRDGNQALVEPMSLDEKIEFYKMLLKIGFKEIEVGFPAASDTEYNFMRALVDGGMIPKDVTVQVLTQAREHIIKKTFQALEGVDNAIVHLYNSTSVAQREQVFKKDKQHIKELAVQGAKLVDEYAKKTEGNFRFEYSPESFHGTEIEYAVDVCNAVLDVWKPTKDKKAIINIPTTVENAMPHVFATQIEYIHKNLKYRDNVILSIHPHNDRGCAVATAEAGVLAGADRVEGTLFGNGERTGNVDVVTVAMNMFSHGYDPELDFSNMKEIVSVYEKLTNMKVSPRQPYAGELVFTAFSGSHQDAIAKGLACREKKIKNGDETWNVPYLPIDPKDVGRTYDSDVIRINSQSGKGGVSYVLKNHYGLTLPVQMREEVGYTIKGFSDREHKELSPEWIYTIFTEKYITGNNIFQIPECHFKQKNGIVADVTIEHDDKKTVTVASGNGRLDAVSNAIKQYFQVSYELSVYEEHAITRGSSSKAAAYVGIRMNGNMYWGVGIDDDIIKASVNALCVAVNRCFMINGNKNGVDEQFNEMMNYIQENFMNVSLDDIADKFHFTKPYVSKYIKVKSGKTFTEIITDIKLKKAKTLLKNESMHIDVIAANVGYQNVEHFNRLFKKRYGMTPGQYRLECSLGR